jgi:nudix-type nucleoside diphosphatase (YffH/AdpP family)
MEKRFKIVVYAPETHAQAIREAMSRAGAGVIGAYTDCTFTAKGVGRFRPRAGANPTIGSLNTLEEVVEDRIETVCDGDKLEGVLQAIRDLHPYDEPAIDVYPLAPSSIASPVRPGSPSMSFEIADVRPLSDGYLKVLAVTVRGDNGRTFTREIADNGRAVAVLPYDPERRTALLVRLPRAGPLYAGGPDQLLEAPAGMIDGEDEETAARREAFEEVGARLGALERLATTWPSPGVSAERTTLFLAAYGARDRVAPGGGIEQEDEHITVVELPLAALWAEADSGRIADLKTFALVMALRLRRPSLFEPR